MKLFYSDKSCVSLRFNFFKHMNFALREKPDIVLLTVAENNADDKPAFLAHHYQCLHCMTFFLPAIPSFLLVFTVLYRFLVSLSVFFGRSMGVSVASIWIISYSHSGSSNAFLPGNRNVPSFISIFSTHFTIR